MIIPHGMVTKDIVIDFSMTSYPCSLFICENGTYRGPILTNDESDNRALVRCNFLYVSDSFTEGKVILKYVNMVFSFYLKLKSVYKKQIRM